MTKLVREFLNEDFYPGPAKKQPISEIDDEHAQALSYDIGEWLGNHEIEINSIAAMDQGEGDWYIDCVWYDMDAREPKHIYLTCSPTPYQHIPRNLKYATHGWPMMAKQIYTNPDLE